MESKVTLYLAQYLLRYYFHSKREMARALNIPYRSLLRLFNGQNSSCDTQRIMNGIACHCLMKRIPHEELFKDISPII